MSHPVASTVESVEFQGDERKARGRNGWFTPHRACVQRFEADRTIAISVESARAYSEMPPLYVHVGLSDARLLLEALSRQIAALEETMPHHFTTGNEDR